MAFTENFRQIEFNTDKEISEVFRATQGDTKSQGFNVVVFLGGKKKVITTETMSFFAQKPDGTRVTDMAVKDGDGFKIELKNQVFAVPGVVACTLVLRGTNGEKLAGRQFNILVAGSMEDGAIISEDEREILDKAFDLAIDIVPRLEDIDLVKLETAEIKETERLASETIRLASEQGRVDAEATRVQEETERKQSEEARGNNEEKRITAENKRESAETERKNAETSRVSAENGRTTAETARVEAETARMQAETTRAGFYDTYNQELQELAEIKADKTYTDEQLALKADSGEIETARGTEPTLGARLDADKAEVSLQLAEERSKVLSADNYLKLDGIRESELITDYVAKDAILPLPLNQGKYEIELAEKGNIYLSNGNFIDIFGLTDGVYTLNGVTVTIAGNEITVTGTATANCYFKLSEGSGFIPSSTGLNKPLDNLPIMDAFCWSLYDKTYSNGVFTVSIRSTVSSNYAGINMSENNSFDNLTDTSKVGQLYLFVASGQVVNANFKLMFGYGLRDVAYEKAPQTVKITDVIKARVTSVNNILSNKSGTAKELIKTTVLTSMASADESNILVKSHTNYFDYYIKGSNQTSKKYLRYRFEQYINPATNANGWVQRLVDAVEIDNGVETYLHPVVIEGEWEMAVKILGRDDFIGCKNHGSEVNFYEKFYIDGNAWIPDESTFYCKEIRVIEKSNMYDPNDEITIVAKHLKDYTINADGIRLKQKIDWLANLTMDISYVTMLPIARGNDTTTPVQVTDTYYDNETYEEWDIGTGGFVTWPQTRTKPNTTKVWMFADSSGISSETECIIKDRKVGASSFVQNTLNRYNKLYFRYCDINYVVANGDVWENESIYRLNINS